MSPEETQALLVKKLGENRELAHRVLFKHRHSDETPPFHTEIIYLFASPDENVCTEAFRGAGKSTVSEEFISIEALYRRFRYCILVGNSYERACERLAAIKHEFETNEELKALYGDCVGPTWAYDQIILGNGLKIQAFGARQSLRGAKHYDQRPDLIVVDDLEDEENVATQDARDKLWRWVMSSLLPALAPGGRVRVLGTPLHPAGVMEKLRRLPGWTSRVYPIIDGEGNPTWPSRFPLDYIAKLRASYEAAGALTSYAQEYLCQSEDMDLKPFQQRHIRFEPIGPSWAPRYVMVDPARTTNKQTSARTGYAVWSWVGTRLHVVEAFGAFHMPNEIVETIFRLGEKHHPVFIGVEKDGLEEFLMQPIRAEMLRRGVSLPVKGLRAPRDKDRFITGLQPFFEAGDVHMIRQNDQNCQDLVNELLSFPTGRKDVVNALAYCTVLRPGVPVYEDFREQHMIEALEPTKKLPAWLTINSNGSSLAGVLLQFNNGRIHVLADWLMEGEAEDCLKRMIGEATMIARQGVKVVAPTERHNVYDQSGLLAAIRRLRIRVDQSSTIEPSRGSLAPYLREIRRDLPVLLVDAKCLWVIGALSGGYARTIKANGLPEELPNDDQYRLVAEALETFVAWFQRVSSSLDDDDRKWAYTPDGRRYISSLPTRRR